MGLLAAQESAGLQVQVLVRVRVRVWVRARVRVRVRVVASAEAIAQRGSAFARGLERFNSTCGICSPSPTLKRAVAAVRPLRVPPRGPHAVE